MVQTMNPNIILIHYKYDPIAFLIRFYTRSYWNHVVWIYNNDFIIESTRSGIIVSSINKYNNLLLYNTQKLNIPRLSHIEKKQLNDYFISLLGKNNFFLRILVFLAVGLKIKRSYLPIKTCSGMIAEGLSKICRRTVIKNKNPLYITPEEIRKYCLEYE